jgi:hypothetical protein
MKKLFILIAFSLISYGAFCQDTGMKKMTDTGMAKHHMMKDCVMMKDGKLKVVKNGNVMMMTGPVKLNNGATVMADGTIKNADGTTTTLTDGQYVDMDGKISTMKSKTPKSNM